MLGRCTLSSGIGKKADLNAAWCAMGGTTCQHAESLILSSFERVYLMGENLMVLSEGLTCLLKTLVVIAF